VNSVLATAFPATACGLAPSAAGKPAEERRERNRAWFPNIDSYQAIPRFLLVRVELQNPEIVKPRARWQPHVFE
jgi:hypothetical protein